MALNFANNQSLSAITSLPASISGGALTLLETQTASSSATISFTSNIDSTYDAYMFKFYDIHPATDQASFQVNFRDGGSSYDATKTTTNFRAYHDEADTGTSLSYYGDEDLAQSTAVQIIGRTVGNGNDECCAGTLKLFAPSNTTFVKHFIVDSNVYEHSDYFVKYHIAGYCNVTAAIDGVQFSFSTGNIDSGVIKLYGIS
jgi:hypothetical protein